MNKKEQAAFDALRQQLAEALAFRRTSPVKRDLPPPDGSTGLSRGWDFNSYSMTASKACSSSVFHGDGWERTSSQQPRHLFTTEALALAALRYEIESKAAKDLAKIDALIAATHQEPQDE